MITAIENATYTLTDVIELREWEEAAECYMSIPEDLRIPCAHCGKPCQRLYEVTRDQDGHKFLIGPSCCKKNLFGWEPEKQVARQMEKDAEKLAKNKGHQKLVDLATSIAEEVRSLPLPEIVLVGTKYGHPAYGMLNSKVAIVCREGLTNERVRTIIDSWKREQVRIRVASIENAKKREKVLAIACGMLMI